MNMSVLFNHQGELLVFTDFFFLKREKNIHIEITMVSEKKKMVCANFAILTRVKVGMKIDCDYVLG